MFHFAFSTNAYTKRRLDEAVVDLARMGYEGVEILADTPHLVPTQAHPRDVSALRKVLEDCLIKPVNLNVNTAHTLLPDAPTVETHFEPSLTHPDPGVRRLRIRYTVRALEIAADLGCPAVSVTPGRRGSGPLARQRDRLKQGLEPILKRAEALGVRVGIEYEPGLVIERGEELVAFLEELPHPLLGANLDLGHAWVVSDDLSAVLPALKGRIWNCHIEDIQDRVHYHLIPGEGNLDFDALRKGLEGIGYDGFLTAELYPYSDRPTYAAERALAFLRERFGKP
jgi:sugar phosphate isomerase/epimerase